MFVRWSDGRDAPERCEAYLSEDKIVTAKFAVLSRQYKLNYRLNSETALNKPIVTWTYGELDGIRLPVLEKECFIFDGWYYGDTKVADENGELVVDDDFLELPELIPFDNGETSIEAKWKAKETFTYKVLIVYVTKIEADLWDRNRIKQHVQFQMTDVQKRFCRENTKRVELYMEDMMDGLVDFEVDEYFTTQTVYTESFKQPDGGKLTTSLYPSYIPEISESDILDEYDVSVSVFGFCDDLTTFEEAHRFQSASGSAFELLPSECQVFLDGIWSWLATVHASSIEDVLDNPDKFNYRREWSNFLETFTHEIAHTIEMRISIYDYHETLSIWGMNQHVGAAQNDKMYYLNELILDGERIGIPYGYWKGEVAKVTYEASTSDYGRMGNVELVTPRGKFGSMGDEQGIVYGYDASAVVAKPFPGYRFVQWSDGVTTPERWDRNITADFTVTAIFEPIVYTINVVASDGGSVKKESSGEVQQQITLSVEYRTFTGRIYAVAQEGYRFVGWSDGTTGNVWSHIVQSNAFLNLFDENNTYTITAIFEKIE